MSIMICKSVLIILYAQSVNGQKFYGLIELMSSNENIRLAYRNIKRNTGSKTAGTDKLTIKDIKSFISGRSNRKGSKYVSIV